MTACTWAPPVTGASVMISGRIQEVRSVEVDGGFYTRQVHDDGSDPSNHFWPAETDWSGV